MRNDDASRPDKGAESGEQVERVVVQHAPALQFDPQDFMEFLEDGELSEAQAVEFLDALWVIIVGFVDLGFNISPVQSVLPVQEFERALAQDSATVIGCKNSILIQQKLTSRTHSRERVRSDS